MCSNSIKPKPEALSYEQEKDLDNQSGCNLASSAVLAD